MDLNSQRERQMERLCRDLRYYKLELERTRNQEQRNRILIQIRDVEDTILRIQLAEKEQLEREQDNIRRALEDLQKFRILKTRKH